MCFLEVSFLFSLLSKHSGESYPRNELGKMNGMNLGFVWVFSERLCCFSVAGLLMVLGFAPLSVYKDVKKYVLNSRSSLTSLLSH